MGLLINHQILNYEPSKIIYLKTRHIFKDLFKTWTFRKSTFTLSKVKLLVEL